MNLQQMQAAINEIREVCLKHGISIVGTCDDEGIYGEIAIIPNNTNSNWLNYSKQITNTVEEYKLPHSDSTDYYVFGIGEV